MYCARAQQIFIPNRMNASSPIQKNTFRFDKNEQTLFAPFPFSMLLQFSTTMSSAQQRIHTTRSQHTRTHTHHCVSLWVRASCDLNILCIGPYECDQVKKRIHSQTITKVASANVYLPICLCPRSTYVAHFTIIQLDDLLCFRISSIGVCLLFFPVFPQLWQSRFYYLTVL